MDNEAIYDYIKEDMNLYNISSYIPRCKSTTNCLKLARIFLFKALHPKITYH